MNRLLLSILFLLISGTSFADHLTVDVFTTAHKAIMHSVVLNPLPTNATVHVYYLDRLETLQRAMNQSIVAVYQGSGKKTAVKQAQTWIKAHRVEYLQFANALQMVYRDHITEIPAIVFNHHEIVLGSVDVNRAYEIYFNSLGYHRE